MRRWLIALTLLSLTWSGAALAQLDVITDAQLRGAVNLTTGTLTAEADLFTTLNLDAGPLLGVIGGQPFLVADFSFNVLDQTLTRARVGLGLDLDTVGILAALEGPLDDLLNAGAGVNFRLFFRFDPEGPLAVEGAFVLDLGPGGDTTLALTPSFTLPLGMQELAPELVIRPTLTLGGDQVFSGSIGLRLFFGEIEALPAVVFGADGFSLRLSILLPAGALFDLLGQLGVPL